MKKIFIPILFVFGFSAYADDLKCSANGTTVLHIPGAFTSGKDLSPAKVELNDGILSTNPNKFDLKKQDADYVPIASEGHVMDKFKYIANTFDATGNGGWAWLPTKRLIQELDMLT